MDDSISQRIADVKRRAEFNVPRWWLTFYLTAPAERLSALGSELSGLNAVNLEGGEGGFLYPKVPTENTTSAIIGLIAQVKGIAERYGVEVVAVDADTSSEVPNSQFAELVRYDGNGS